MSSIFYHDPDKLDAIGSFVDYLISTESRRDAVQTAIGACITEGFTEHNEIVDVLNRFGFSRQYISRMLLKRTARRSKRHFWVLDNEGRYNRLN